jgi:hypothetical protein
MSFLYPQKEYDFHWVNSSNVNITNFDPQYIDPENCERYYQYMADNPVRVIFDDTSGLFYVYLGNGRATSAKYSREPIHIRIIGDEYFEKHSADLMIKSGEILKILKQAHLDVRRHVTKTRPDLVQRLFSP